MGATCRYCAKARLKAPPLDPACCQNVSRLSVKAAFFPEFPTNIRATHPAQQHRLPKPARFEARLNNLELPRSGAVRERRASEPYRVRRLFRLWDGRYPGSESCVCVFRKASTTSSANCRNAQQKSSTRSRAVPATGASLTASRVSEPLISHELPAIVATDYRNLTISKGMWTKFLTGTRRPQSTQRDLLLQTVTDLRHAAGGKTQYFPSLDSEHRSKPPPTYRSQPRVFGEVETSVPLPSASPLRTPLSEHLRRPQRLDSINTRP